MSETSNEEAKNEEAKNGISQEARKEMDAMNGSDATYLSEVLERVDHLFAAARCALSARDMSEANKHLVNVMEEVANAVFWSAAAVRRELRTYKMASAAANFDQSSTGHATGSR